VDEFDLSDFAEEGTAAAPEQAAPEAGPAGVQEEVVDLDGGFEGFAQPEASVQESLEPEADIDEQWRETQGGAEYAPAAGPPPWAAEINEEAGRLRAENERLREQVGQAQAETVRAHDELGRLRAEGGELREEVARLRADGLRAHEELGRLRVDAHQVREEIGRLQAELRAQHGHADELAPLRAEIRELRELVAPLQGENRDAREALRGIQALLERQIEALRTGREELRRRLEGDAGRGGA
jgi:regulator of replication initiation timing